jgi:cell filamentation protein
VLKNKLGLRDQGELSAFEALSVAVRAEEPLPVGRFSAAHYCAVHRHLFQDVYGWAGRYRTVRMTKDRSPFCFPENIGGEMRKLFARLQRADLLRGREAKAFAAEAATFLSDLNAIHPLQAGHPLKLSRLDPARFLQAMIASFFGDEAPLRLQLQDLVLD